MKLSALLTVLAAATVVPLASAQSTDKGLYGELGYVSMTYKEPSTSTSPSTVRAFIGNNVSENWVLEAMFGMAASNGTGTLANVPYTVKIGNMVGVFVRAKTKPTPELEVYGRLGYNRLDRTVDVLTISSASTGDDVAYGAGLAYKIAAKTHVTADYMAYYNKNNIAIDGLAVGLRFRF